MRNKRKENMGYKKGRNLYPKHKYRPEKSEALVEKMNRELDKEFHSIVACG